MDDKNDEIKNDSQLELFTKINSFLDDVVVDIDKDHEPVDPRDDPFSPDYQSKVVCPIDDKKRYIKPS